MIPTPIFFNKKPDDDGPSFSQVVRSVLAAAFGVQSDANRERDFKARSPVPFIVVGLGATVVFVLLVWLVVKLVLTAAGV